MKLCKFWLVKELVNGLLIDPYDYDKERHYFNTSGYSLKDEALEAIIDSECSSSNLVILEHIYRFK